MGRRREPGPPGILLLDKPAGVTSAAATRTVGRHFRLDPVGHTGTLDPAATGLLVICTGYATRLVPWLQAGEKDYSAQVRFGEETTTFDAEGEVTRVADPPPELAAALAAALPSFVGQLTQVPPSFSAVRVDGERAHVRARRGEVDAKDIPSREVMIHALEILRVEGADAWFDVCCSPGTYIRSLAADLGRALGSAAHLAGLRRERTGGFHVDDAVGLDALLALSAPGEHWRPLPDALPNWPRRLLDERELSEVLNGGAVEDRDGHGAGPILMVDSRGAAVAVGEGVDGPDTRQIVVRRLLTSNTRVMVS